jgi:hypothetical protein
MNPILSGPCEWNGPLEYVRKIIPATGAIIMLTLNRTFVKTISIVNNCKLFKDKLFIIASLWLKEVIVPWFKNKGDQKEPSNYRPIILLSCLGKQILFLIQIRLTFEKAFCQDHIFTLHSVITILKQNRKTVVFCVFIDLSVVFSLVVICPLLHMHECSPSRWEFVVSFVPSFSQVLKLQVHQCTCKLADDVNESDWRKLKLLADDTVITLGDLTDF